MRAQDEAQLTAALKDAKDNLEVMRRQVCKVTEQGRAGLLMNVCGDPSISHLCARYPGHRVQPVPIAEERHRVRGKEAMRRAAQAQARSDVSAIGLGQERLSGLSLNSL